MAWPRRVAQRIVEATEAAQVFRPRRVAQAGAPIATQGGIRLCQGGIRFGSAASALRHGLRCCGFAPSCVDNSARAVRCHCEGRAEE